MTADKTGAETTVSLEDGRVHDCRGGQDTSASPISPTAATSASSITPKSIPAYGGRGLATILVEEALNEARGEGKRIVPVCSMVGTVLKKHPEFDDITDPVNRRGQGWAQTQPSS